MRTKNSIKNLIFALFGQAFGLIISFLGRIVFVKILTDEYLGLNSLFTNILTMLSLVELGVGSAIVYSLYKPLAVNDKEKIKSLMFLYKKAYTLIGIIIMLLGIISLPFYRYLINEVPDIKNLDLIYFLFVLNTSVSYFYSYKRSLIISDQKRYIATIYRYGFYFILNVVQIIVLLITKNYLLFLIVQVIFTWLENVFVSIKADKMYPYLKEKKVEKLKTTELKKIKQNINAMLFHKIGGVVINSTDNILIAKFIGLVSVGLYSNYYLIINALEIIIIQFFNAIVASIGNLGATRKNSEVKETFDITLFINFVIFGVSSICLLILFNPFIKIWLGKKYVFDFSIVLVIVICFYLKGIRKTCLTYKDALGFFKEDKYKPVIESIINLVSSIILAKYLGLLGIFLGTVISTLTTSIWIEPYVLYKHYFKTSIMDYFKRVFKYVLVTIISYLVTLTLCNLVNINEMVNLIIKLIICLIIPIILYIICFRKTEEFKKIKTIFSNLRKERSL